MTTKPSSVDLSAIAEHYSNSLRDHGPTPAGVGWRDKQSQSLRFEKLASVLDADGRGGLEIAELGCGYAAFFDYLVSRQVRVRSFIGYDLDDKILDMARNRVRDPRCRFCLAERVEEPVDYSVASGIFNVRFDVDEETWTQYVESALDNFNAKSRHGFAFNCLSTYVDFRMDHLYYGDPLHFFDYCKKNFSSRVFLLHDYPLYEWTIGVRK